MEAVWQEMGLVRKAERKKTEKMKRSRCRGAFVSIFSFIYFYSRVPKYIPKKIHFVRVVINLKTIHFDGMGA